MSRSFKTYAGGGWGARRSEKKDKSLWHRAWRRKTKQLLTALELDGEPALFSVRQVSNPYTMNKDGKGLYFRHIHAKRTGYLAHCLKYRDGRTLSKRETHKVIGK